MLLSRMKVKDGRIVTKDEVIVASDYIGSGFDIYQTGANSFEGRGIEYDTRGIIFKGNSLKEVQEKIKRHEGELTRIVINQDSIAEGSKIVVNTENHVNESAIAVTINESDCLVRFENGDEETVPIEAVSAFESMANDASAPKDFFDLDEWKIKAKSLGYIVENNSQRGLWVARVGIREMGTYNPLKGGTLYTDQSSTETESQIAELTKNMDAARARGYDTAPYQKEIDRLKSMDVTAFNIGDKVKADITAQGMVKGNKYEIVDIDQNFTPFGNFVSYKIKGDGKEFWINNGHLLLSKSTDKYTGDPLTDKGQEIMASLKEQYGEEKGEQVFYAMKNSGQIEGID